MLLLSRVSLNLLLALALSGCAGRRAREKVATAVRPGPSAIGVVALVNPDLQFVLIDVDMGAAPPVGLALKTFPAGTPPADSAETSILTVSAERRPPFIAADIVKGEPSKGDAVYR